MKKIIFLMTVVSVFTLKAQPVFNSSFTNKNVGVSPGDEEKPGIRIGSSRASGDLQLHFTAPKAGKAIITVQDESGKVVLQQTNEVTTNKNIIPLKQSGGLPGGQYTVQLIVHKKAYTANFLSWK